MQILLLNDIMIIFGLAIVVIFICNRLRIPAVVGYLLTGIIVGPYGFGFISALHEVEILAEIGIVLLLFTIGIEFSFRKLLDTKKSVLIGGPLQVLLTFGAAFFIARHFGLQFGEKIFMGFLISLSSTAIVLKIIQERAEVDSHHGRIILGILIFQDIIVVPMILITPLLSPSVRTQDQSIIIFLVKGAGLLLFLLVSTKWIAPKILFQIARIRNQEVFLLSILLICFSIAWLTSMAGLSLALGAFLAGLIISESEYSHQALGSILPFRDVFTSFFFVSIGMLLNLEFLFRQPIIILLITLGVIMLKFLIAGFSTTLIGAPFRTAIISGLAVSQVGEFSFILSKVGIDFGILSENVYQMFLAFSIISMALTPFIISMAPGLADIFLKIPIPKKLKIGFSPVQTKARVKMQDHLVIVGYGINGKNVARAAQLSGIPFTVIEMNPDIVREERKNGVNILFGDSTQQAVLKHINIEEARVAVIAINDPPATRRITNIMRKLNSNIYLIVRSRFLQEMSPLYNLGANEVIPEEFETSVEIFTRVLSKYLISRDKIESLTAEIRSDGYRMLRSLSKESTSYSDFHLSLPEIEIGTLRITENSPLIGKNLAEIDMRKKYDATVLAVRRDIELFSNPDTSFVFNSDDFLYILGTPKNIAEISCMCKNPD
jgi:CPA2 family monovalent cation:H+ antiporter-2